MALPKNPITREEQYLSNIAGEETNLPEKPLTREEQYLEYIALNGGGGGGGGTTNYNQLTNKPKINGVTLSGNKSASDLGLITASSLPVVPADLSDFNNDVGFITEQDIPTNVSDFTNDAGYVTSDDVPTKTSDLTNDRNFVTETAMNTALAGKVNTSSMGVASGIAELDANGKVPQSQLPSYVDDVVDGYYKEADGKFYEESTYTTEIPGEDGKIYISVDTSIQYRWTGSAFSALGGALILGETSSTAYRGDRGKIAYDDSQANKTAIGDMSDLTTTANDLVGAINEVSENMPDPITAGDGIDITNSEISVDAMPSADMSEVVTPLPSTKVRMTHYKSLQNEDAEILIGTVNIRGYEYNLYEKYIYWEHEVNPEASGDKYYLVKSINDLKGSHVGIKAVCDIRCMTEDKESGSMNMPLPVTKSNVAQQVFGYPEYCVELIYSESTLQGLSSGGLITFIKEDADASSFGLHIFVRYLAED